MNNSVPTPSVSWVVLLVPLTALACSEDSGGSTPTDAGDTQVGVDFGVEAGGDQAVEDELTEQEIRNECLEYCLAAGDCERTEDVGGDTCQDDCRAALAEDVEFAADIACVTSVECQDFDRCFEEIPALSGCERVCEAVADCGFLEAFEFASADTCPFECSGSLFAGEAGDGANLVLSCFEASLGAGRCDIYGAQQCVGEGPDCADYCVFVDSCAGADAIRADLADSGACEATCNALSGGARAAFGLCLNIRECGSTSCSQVEDDPPDGCDSACAAAISACGGDDPVTEAVCPWWCSALDASFEASQPEAVADCAAELAECPETGAEAPSYVSGLVACQIVPSESCQAVCDGLAGCSSELAGSDIECRLSCVQIEEVNALFIESLATCIENAEGDTPAELCAAREACLPE